MDNIKKAKQIIEENIYMTIAMASKAGEPWISPVFFAYDTDFNLYWVSNKDARHSNLIRNNPKIAIVIFNSKALEGTGTGVYFEAKVSELEDTGEIEKAKNFLDKRVKEEEFRIKKVGDVTGQGVWRIYKAIQFKTSILAGGEYINGQYVDKREEINLH